jgi:hypothetical protein
MNKYMLIVLVLLSIATYQVAEAQSKLFLGIGGELSFPSSDYFIRNVNMGSGFSVVAQYSFTPSIAVIGMAGYIKWPPADEDIILRIENGVPTASVERTAHYTAIPILFGAKGYFNQGTISVYGMILFGVYKMTIEAQDRPEGYYDVPEFKKDQATIGFGLGIEIQISNSIALDLSGRYQFLGEIAEAKDFSNYGLRAGLLFGIL